jgi:hypothetical protein
VVSVATVAPQIVASSASAALSWRRNLIDLKLATVLMLSGIVGTGIGVVVFTALRAGGRSTSWSRSYVTLSGWSEADAGRVDPAIVNAAVASRYSGGGPALLGAWPAV